MPTTTHILSDETGQLMLDELEGIHEALDNGTFGGIPMSQKGAANGVATLDASSHVPSGQLPSYVDDVIEGYYYNGAFYSDSSHTTLITGETGKIYVDLSSDTSYRWSGSAYISISNPIDVATEQEALAGSDNTKMMTPLRVHQVVSGDIEPNSVTAAGEVTATETVDGSTVLHELTDKLDEEDYLSGLTWGQIKAKYTWGDLKGNTSSDMHTPNLNLSKPARLSPTAMNGNMDILDAKVPLFIQVPYSSFTWNSDGNRFDTQSYSIPSGCKLLGVLVTPTNGGGIMQGYVMNGYLRVVGITSGGQSINSGYEFTCYLVCITQ